MWHDLTLIVVALAVGAWVDRKGLPYIGHKIEEGFNKVVVAIHAHANKTSDTQRNTAVK